MTKLSRLDTSSETSSDAAKVPRRAHNRLPKLLDEAARVFAKRGFAAASIREIVEPVGMLPGSVYYHFETKEALLVAVYREGVERITAKVDAAIQSADEPWKRLEAACIGHLSALLDSTDYSQVVIRIRPDDAPVVAAELALLRRSYESRFEMLIEMLPLPKFADRRDLRLLLMGALNWSQTWFREGGALTPAEIASRFIQLLKMDLLKP
ncbi:MAG: TetR/AcrR family transcriptional regulator [Burkholderiaceae bacterium]|nr:TetR/AcrR family transcriptional regulator [Burkholderiaceae bacterium]